MVFRLIEPFRNEHHECGSVMMRIGEAKFDISDQPPFELFYWVSRLIYDLAQPLHQPSKGFLAYLLQQLGFILEVDVNRRRRILDLVRNPPHGHIFISIAHEQFAGGIQDLLPEKLLLPRSAFFYAHAASEASLT